ncbi:phosphatidate cytidylyltransferase [Rhodobacter aestuarii]|uniref:Phosphatidate cytidylyltransferase n=1 Tax=Rhodobacter aestuarii TaxID=453582 RepID=A0A1N7M2Y7_9RHOB|nr:MULTISPECIES: phosphatidate cytidylyltransferase [Rhodobacter]PTV94812.1 phosphatidate cytidylyltransferase [Rhodobacter aestuarii]SIS80486.1 phosphatidate cytidylyltransferase [Rhodobacter aestuarii]SOC14267.1 phosphatidate cytidylyltransferase [Rhodobacter sp. JA431]
MSANWSDLRARTLSGIAMVAVGGFAIWWGGVVFGLLAALVVTLMIWELAQMTTPEGVSGLHAKALAAFAGALTLLVLFVPNAITRIALLLPVIVGTLLPRRDKPIFAAYAFFVMATGYALIMLHHWIGALGILWLVAVVVASDVAGYFAGRALGGPKFWPRFSPKKTWSGTVAGWIGAAGIGALFWVIGMGSAVLIPLSALIAFSGQMGDIAESAIKRRMGVKDSSNLIPGHGGLLDRFDALIGAVSILLLIYPLLPQNFFGG